MGDTTQAPGGEIILYETKDGRSRIDCRFDGDTLWLTQAQMAELYDRDVRTISEHLQAVYEDEEITRERTIRNFRIVRTEGNRKVSREIEHYDLTAILSVGYRVRSPRGVQFRQWATSVLHEYMAKGFVLDDQRLKNPPGPGVPDYFDELHERIRAHTSRRERSDRVIAPRAALGTSNAPRAFVVGFHRRLFLQALSRSAGPGNAPFRENAGGLSRRGGHVRGGC